MKNTTAIRFAIATVVMTAGCVLMLFGIPDGLILFGLAGPLSLTRSELTQRVPRREFWIMIAFLVAAIALSVACKVWIPASTRESVKHVIVSPLLVVPLWFVTLWALLRLWRSEGRHQNA